MRAHALEFPTRGQGCPHCECLSFALPDPRDQRITRLEILLREQGTAF
jgi:hypothetical protein